MLPLSETKSKKWINYLHLGERQFLKRETLIYEEGTRGTGDVYFLEKGKVKVYTAAFTGKTRTLEILHAGMAFGEQTVDKKPYFSTAIVLEDAVVYRFSSEVTKALVKEDQTFRQLMFKSLRSKLELLLNNIVLHSLPAEKILAHTLVEISKKYDNQSILPLSQHEITQYTGLTRITIYKLLKKWGPEVVKTKNKKIVITDLDSIKRVLSH
ncbi:Crp/Fnr family transcriptional regulator [Alteribacillus iranensis]|uniref:cAMP-binding domain of CRP or a regulatory subunit of cAMP-dependent protein kinases n=1 Tax=Alteribacillus iranensis TaxID=930128 RepID=A0A1I2E976_9BACI|nr:Crp/Fnr family transcriptional regulator [Alteribacillus iranensis]SFE89554.1 cAMP-binding domain of CRP or a regulatory subunit of cAMP-dependent protein kinases [Alteribacillus iranensis]